MVNAFKQLLGMEPKTDLAEIIKNGAIILDVRSNGEYASGHLKGSINIPLNNLGNSLGQLKKGKPIITCCASGMRSSSAKSLLTSNGFTEVYNGGSWTSLRQYENLIGKK